MSLPSPPPKPAKPVNPQSRGSNTNMPLRTNISSSPDRRQTEIIRGNRNMRGIPKRGNNNNRGNIRGNNCRQSMPPNPNVTSPRRRPVPGTPENDLPQLIPPKKNIPTPPILPKKPVQPNIPRKPINKFQSEKNMSVLPPLPKPPTNNSNKPILPPKPNLNPSTESNLPILPRSKMLDVGGSRKSNSIKRASVAISKTLDLRLPGSEIMIKNQEYADDGDDGVEKNNISSPDTDRKKQMKKMGSKIFPTRKKTDADKADIERSLNGEMVVKGNWEKKSEENSLAKKLQKEAERMEREKTEKVGKSKNLETENSRLIKWRDMLEKIQQEDKVEISNLEKEVSKASKTKEDYAQRVKLLEEECMQLMKSLDNISKDLKIAM